MPLVFAELGRLIGFCPAFTDTWLRLMEGAAELATALPKIIGPTALLDTKKNLQKIWELFGLYFLNQGRVHEAIPLFYGLYDRLLDCQEQTHRHVPKGMSFSG